MDIIKFQRLIKSLSIFAFLFFILAMFIIVETPLAVGYELSLYEVLPISFWIFIISSIVISEIIIILSSISRKYNHWWYGLLSLLIGYFLILILPTLRGYVLYGRGQGDILVHIGWAKDILNTGQINEIFYPIVHILSADLNYIGFSLESAANFISAYSSVIYIIFIYILAKSISKNTKKSLFLLAFASPLLFSYFHISIHPSILSIFMLPLFLYSFHKIRTENSNIGFKIIALIMAFLIVFFHPITNIITIVILIVFAISSFFQDKIILHRCNRYAIRYLIMILTVSFFTWVLSFYKTSKSIQSILHVMFYQTRSTITESYVNLLSAANLSISQTIELIISSYGPILIYFTVSFFCVVYVLNDIYKRKIEYLKISYCLQFIAGIIFAVVFLFGYFIEVELVRISRYAIIMSTILSALVLYEIFINNRGKDKGKLVAATVILIICSASVLGVLNIYTSPRIYKPSNHLTHMEKTGFSCIIENRNSQIPLVGTGFNFGNYEIYYFGFEYAIRNMGKSVEGTIPSHFGYHTNYTLRDSFNKYDNIYMILTEFNRQAHLAFPKNIRKEANQYLTEDFEILNNDYTVNKIYENGEFGGWFI